MQIEPEAIILAGSVLWGLAGFVTGVPKNDVPAHYPFVFFVVATIGGLIGLSEIVHEPLDTSLTFLAAVLFFVAPLGFIIYALKEYPPGDMLAGVLPAREDEQNGEADNSNP
jgi:hypothetical protein